MIKITVEIYPFGVTEEKRTIGELFIVNDGTGTIEFGNYSYGINKINQEGDVEAHHIGLIKKHKRFSGVWSLIGRILNTKECKDWQQGLFS